MRLHDEADVAEYLRNGWWVPDTWSTLLSARVAEAPDRLAVLDPGNRAQWLDGTPQRWTWRELDEQAGRLVTILYTAGIRAEDIVIVQLPNSVELVATYFALSRLGAIASPLPVQYREHEITQLGSLLGAAALITATRIGTRRSAERAVALRDRLPALGTIFAWGPGAPPTVIELDTARPSAGETAAAAGYCAQRAEHPNDCVTICWTSGTEGTPKAVPRAHGDWIAMAWGNVDGPQLTAADVLLNPFPMVNMAGLSGMMLAWLLSGSLLVQHHPFDLDTYLRQIEDERVTYTLAPPALLTRMLHQPEILARADISSLRILGSGSAPLSPSLLTGWRDQYGLEIINCFGSNEGLCLNGDPAIVPDAGDRARYFPRFGAGGYTWPIRSTRGFRSRLVDAATGQQIDDAGHPAEIRIKGPNVFAGYWTPTGLDRSGFDDEGFFRTGEIFEISAVDGDPRYYRYVSRRKDLIVRGGMNISPAEIEGLVAAHPAVAETAVVGYPDEELGERSCAFVVTRPGASLTLADLTGYLRQRDVASYKIPERLEIIDALPRNPLGKVIKTALRAAVSGAAVSGAAVSGAAVSGAPAGGTATAELRPAPA